MMLKGKKQSGSFWWQICPQASLQILLGFHSNPIHPVVTSQFLHRSLNFWIIPTLKMSALCRSDNKTNNHLSQTCHQCLIHSLTPFNMMNKRSTNPTVTCHFQHSPHISGSKNDKIYYSSSIHNICHVPCRGHLIGEAAISFTLALIPLCLDGLCVHTTAGPKLFLQMIKCCPIQDDSQTIKPPHCRHFHVHTHSGTLGNAGASDFGHHVFFRMLSRCKIAIDFSFLYNWSIWTRCTYVKNCVTKS